jgi:hypothetical protein
LLDGVPALDSIMEATLMYKFGKAILIGALALTFSFPAANSAAAQEGGAQPIPIASGDKVRYAGFVSEAPVSTDMRIVGSVNEAFRKLLIPGERVFINRGSSQGVQVGEVYQIVRPRGAFYHPFKNARLHFPSFSRRGDRLGYYNEEVGLARVLAIQESTSTLEITEVFTDVRFGDVLLPYQKRDLPEQKAYSPIDPLAAPTGKTTGQIVLARSTREQLVSQDIVIIDLGEKSGVKIGDYFTIFREQGSDSLNNNIREDEITFRNVDGGSERFRGDSKSIVHPNIQKDKIDKLYPGKVLPRTVVGELVVTRVEGTTATAIITRVQSGEAYLGDFVELQ